MWLRAAVDTMPWKEGDILTTDTGVELEVLYANSREVFVRPVGLMDAFTITPEVAGRCKHTPK